MKPIEQMNLQECLDLLHKERMPIVTADGEVFDGMFDHRDRITIANRIHELTRWIPVEERWPTEEDADEAGRVLIREVERQSPYRVYHDLRPPSSVADYDYFYEITHWRRLDKLEGV